MGRSGYVQGQHLGMRAVFLLRCLPLRESSWQGDWGVLTPLPRPPPTRSPAGLSPAGWRMLMGLQQQTAQMLQGHLTYMRPKTMTSFHYAEACLVFLSCICFRAQLYPYTLIRSKGFRGFLAGLCLASCCLFPVCFSAPHLVLSFLYLLLKPQVSLRFSCVT